ncbi:ImmA/IrrE family metallo-endopeptidase [Xanthomonas nasturtii]|uniref:ImmA/IrrE family metallo-endopeptidase n=1 Tax=Xanthomonas nasturtii TaxID=1843581 RepID=UPI0020129243|nr:ImmA/IrrE family metallo-endopeptidase [Xanthomonas nasturtii]MCL1569852.1 ImmA/IrrE family metallo-endopeptidase [Xanthomonas nasturtii]MCL1573146.1 ImmA/IrrE family metallo-endopeptidase [Xanthomonas nasturtii]MCL1580935.1 ImmA/IrrE family metallo-endopeptidase [Xanthomonas nasturtii]MCL1584818.1 ImmA/IrrE family metallo-endopeptidase [Xanthomonas nasturtii]MCL1590759.1 ImmA/IrrE family metallo-endopeptidase [Xanthomonas nasturtii]
MGNKIDGEVSASRILLGNQYAHIEELEGAWELAHYQNPYRYADRDVGRRVNVDKSHNDDSIKLAVRALHRDLWNRRNEFGLGSRHRPIDLLRPELAAKILGYEFQEVPSLGWMMQGRRQIAVAGLIDQASRTIKLARDIEPSVARFTAAHEIGHAVLHPHLSGLHRDRPLKGAKIGRNPVEREADAFATIFLMPERLVCEEFGWRFLGPFALNEQTSFALMGRPLWEVEELFPTLRHVSRHLAGAASFNGQNFKSLAELFGVSNEAMAIRLEELKLVVG